MLLQKVIGKQQQLGMSDREFARELGISRPVWYKTRTGQRKLGMKVIAGIVKRFPELSADVLIFFRDYISNWNGAVSK